MEKKIINKSILLLTLLTPTIVKAEEVIICGNDKRIPSIFGTIISTIFIIIRILIPLIFVITGMISFFKVAISSKIEDDMKKAKDKLINNIMAAVIIFFIVSIVNFIISLAAGKNNNFSNCLNCMIHPDNCEKDDDKITKLCPGLMSEQAYYDADCNYIGEAKERTDYDSGKEGVQEYEDTAARAGGGAIARTLQDNPNALEGQNIIAKTDEKSGYSYYLYVPEQVDNKDSPPLIVYLHGNGTECGYGYDLMKKGFGFAKYIDEGMKFNTYILMPQKHDKNGWNIQAIKRIMDEEIKNNNIDKNRISIWGYSAGAESAPDLVNTYPNTFASAVILAKGSDDPITGFNGVSTYAFYGTADTYANKVTPNFIKKLQNAGHTAYIKAYEGVDHNHVMEQLMIDNDIGNGFTNIMDWVLDQKR